MALIVVGDRIKNTKRNSVGVDEFYGPYEADETTNRSALQVAEDALTSAHKLVPGQTVGIKQSNGEVKDYQVQPKGTTPETYGLVEKGAGTTDYNDLENKPTIGDGTNTALPIVGNVKVSASTASGSTAGVTVTPGQNTGEIEMQFSLPKGGDAYEVYKSTVPEGQSPMTKEEWLETLKGADGADGQDGAPGHNPCLGRFPDIPSPMPAGQVGDYLYVDITTVDQNTQEETTTTTVYHYVDDTNGWDNGTVVDAEHPKLASGQNVTDVHIKNENGDDVNGSANVLSAEAGAELAEKTNEVNVWSAASLSAAIALVPQGMRKAGLKVTYQQGTAGSRTDDGRFTYQYVGSDTTSTNWENTDNWVELNNDCYYWQKPVPPRNYVSGYFSSSGNQFMVYPGITKIAWIRVEIGDIVHVHTYMYSSTNMWYLCFCDHIPTVSEETVEPLAQGVLNTVCDVAQPIIKNGYIGVCFRVYNEDSHPTTIHVAKSSPDFGRLIFEASKVDADNTVINGEGVEVIDTDNLEGCYYNLWSKKIVDNNCKNYKFAVEEGYFYLCKIYEVGATIAGTLTLFSAGQAVFTKRVTQDNISNLIIVPKGISHISVAYNSARGTSVKKYPMSALLCKANADVYTDAILSNIGNASIEKTATSLTDSRIDFEDEYPKYSKVGGCLTVDAKITEFNKIELGVNPNDDSSSTWPGNLKCVIDSEKIQFFTKNRMPNILATFYHRLNIGTFIRVSFSWYDYHYKTVLSTLDGVFTCEYDDITWDIYGTPFVRVNDLTSLTDVKVRLENAKLRKPIWVFGDSYTSISNTRWPYYVYKEFGIRDFYLCGLAGGTSAASSMLGQFRKAVALATPRYIVWALGMNDTEGATNNYQIWEDAYNEVKAYCDEKGVILVSTTIPNTPIMTNTTKNAYIEANASRIWDAAGAVGASEAESEWYSGCLHTDNVHPTAKGAKVLAGSLITAVPELMNYCIDSNFAKLNNRDDVIVKEDNSQTIGGKALDIYYNVTANTQVDVCKVSQVDKIIVDNVEVIPPSTPDVFTYTFTTAGEHKVSLVLKKDGYGNTVIPSAAFYFTNRGLNHVTKIVISNEVISLDVNCFLTASMSTLVVPQSVRNIDSGSLGYCSNLTKIIMLSSVSNNILINSNAFSGNTSTTGIIYTRPGVDFSSMLDKLGPGWVQKEIVSTIDDLIE